MEPYMASDIAQVCGIAFVLIGVGKYGKYDTISIRLFILAFIVALLNF